MVTTNRRVSHEKPSDSQPTEFQWVDIYPLIGLVALAGYIILG